MGHPLIFLVLGAVISCEGLIAPGVSPAQENDGDLCVKRFVPPTYPPLARQARIQGDVAAQININKLGEVTEILDTEGPPLLVDVVKTAIKKWRFAQTASDKSNVRITFRFVLSGPEAEHGKTEIDTSLPFLVEIRTNPPPKIGPDVRDQKPKRKS